MPGSPCPAFPDGRPPAAAGELSLAPGHPLQAVRARSLPLLELPLSCQAVKHLVPPFTSPPPATPLDVNPTAPLGFRGSGLPPALASPGSFLRGVRGLPQAGALVGAPSSREDVDGPEESSLVERMGPVGSTDPDKTGGAQDPDAALPGAQAPRLLSWAVQLVTYRQSSVQMQACGWDSSAGRARAAVEEEVRSSERCWRQETLSCFPRLEEPRLKLSAG